MSHHPMMMMPSYPMYYPPHHSHMMYPHVQNHYHHEQDEQYHSAEKDELLSEEQFQSDSLPHSPSQQSYHDVIVNANHELNKEGWSILEDEEEIGKPSNEGYQKAWNDLERKLESGELSGEQYIPAAEKPYAFQENNPFLSSTFKKENLLGIHALFQEGMTFYQKGQIAQAILRFESILQHPSVLDSSNYDGDGNLSEIWKMLGICHTENDNEISAIQSFERSSELDPYNLSTLLALGTCYVNELDSVKALNTLKTWINNNPKFIGLDLSSQEDEYSDGTLMDEVIQLMLTVSHFAPNDTEVQVLLGILYNISQDYDSAIEAFSKALASNPNDFDLLNKV
jgi:tetratricopeptide (TPR) repeat protein